MTDWISSSSMARKGVANSERGKTHQFTVEKQSRSN
jgi:hypothetical protein